MRSMCIPICAYVHTAMCIVFVCVCECARAMCIPLCAHCIPLCAHCQVHTAQSISLCATAMCTPPCAYCQPYHVYVSRFSLSSLTTAILIPLLHAPSLSRSLSLSHTHTHTHTHTNTCTHTHTPHTHPAARVVEMLLDVWVMEYGASAIFLCYLSLVPAACIMQPNNGQMERGQAEVWHFLVAVNVVTMTSSCSAVCCV